MGNFQNVLNKRSAEVEKPKPLPVGSYIAMIEGLPEFKELGENKTDAAIFKVKILAPGPDVDPTNLAEAGGVANKTIRMTQFITEDSLWRVKKLLVDDLGIDEGDKTILEMINECPGRQLTVNIKHRPSPDGQALYAEIGSTAPAR